MVTPTGSVRLYDGLAELAGVSSRAIARQPVLELGRARPSEPALLRREPDRVELSTAACKDGQCDKDERVEREARAEEQQEPRERLDVYA